MESVVSVSGILDERYRHSTELSSSLYPFCRLEARGYLLCRALGSLSTFGTEFAYILPCTISNMGFSLLAAIAVFSFLRAQEREGERERESALIGPYL